MGDIFMTAAHSEKYKKSIGRSCWSVKCLLLSGVSQSCRHENVSSSYVCSLCKVFFNVLWFSSEFWNLAEPDDISKMNWQHLPVCIVYQIDGTMYLVSMLGQVIFPIEQVMERNLSSKSVAGQIQYSWHGDSTLNT